MNKNDGWKIWTSIYEISCQNNRDVFSKKELNESKERLKNVINEVTFAYSSRNEKQIIKAQDTIDVYTNLHPNMNKIDRNLIIELIAYIDNIKALSTVEYKKKVKQIKESVKDYLISPHDEEKFSIAVHSIIDLTGRLNDKSKRQIITNVLIKILMNLLKLNRFLRK